MQPLFKSKRHGYYAAAIIAACAIAGISLYAQQSIHTTSISSYRSPLTSSNSQNSTESYQPVAIPTETVLASTSAETVDQLLYLIEEEKLAHDVYLKMYEKYGARIFGNILRSENTHQSRVLSVLVARGVDDPRSETVGVFNNQKLQQLYDELIAQGNQNLTEAYKVGVAIEELDIADLKEDIESLDPAQTDVMAMLESLLKGSENHLRAFNRQVR